MKFLADENFPKPVIITIRRLGHSVKTIQQEKLRGSSDETVAGIALVEKRLVLTFDKDFLENQVQSIQTIVFHFPKVPTSEIIPLVEEFLLEVGNINTKFKTLIFSKNGLQIVS